MQTKTINIYSIIKEIGLVIQLHRFEITIEYLKNIKQKILKDPDFEPHYTFLIDIRDTYGTVSVEETTEYGKFVTQTMETGNQVRLALLTNNPEHVAKGSIFRWMTAKSNLEYGIFTTVEGGLNWLNVSNKDFTIAFNELEKLRSVTHKY